MDGDEVWSDDVPVNVLERQREVVEGVEAFLQQVPVPAVTRTTDARVAFTRTAEIDLGHLNPVPLTRAMLETIIQHAREVSDRCGRRMLLENITSHVRLAGDLAETDFFNTLCERSGCKLLLDVTNLFINSRNHDFDPLTWLREIEPQNIVQLHIVGYSRQGIRYADSHAAPIQEELIELAREVIRYAPVQAVILERDEDFPDINGLEVEVAKLQRICG